MICTRIFCGLLGAVLPAVSWAALPVNAAHRDAYFLSQVSGSDAPAQNRELQLVASGTAAATEVANMLDKCTEVVVRSTDKQWNFANLQNSRTATGLNVPDDAIGTTLVALVIRESVTLTADEQREQFAREEMNRATSTTPPGKGKAPTTVARVFSLKSIARIGSDATRNSEIATAKLGQPAEIRLLADPLALGIDADLPFRAYLDGSTVPDARISALHVASGTQTKIATDPKGIGHFRLSHAGEWRITFHVLQASADEPENLVWHTATMTFTVPDRGAE